MAAEEALADAQEVGRPMDRSKMGFVLGYGPVQLETDYIYGYRSGWAFYRNVLGDRLLSEGVRPEIKIS